MIALRAFVSEAVGTALLLAAVVASGIVTSDGDPDPSVQLLQHGIVVGLALAVLIALLAPSSGAHFNPIVTAAMWWSRDLTGRIALGYVAAQVTGAFAGTAVANLMFGLAAVGQATGLRAGMPVLGGELLASAALLLVILGLVRTGRTSAVPAVVGTWISAAIFFTSSTSLTDPAATLARCDGYVRRDRSRVGARIPQCSGRCVPPHRSLRGLAVPARPSGHGGPPAHHSGGSSMNDVPTALFLCVHNIGRSQMAAGWLQHLAADRVRVLSGGSEPAESVNPSAVAAMHEVGIDITGSTPNAWTEVMLSTADGVVTMGCGDTCPVIPVKRCCDWPLDDPAARDVAGVRPVRDQMERLVRGLMDELDVLLGA